MHTHFQQVMETHRASIGKVVNFDPLTDVLLPLDFTVANTELSADTLANTQQFSAWIDAQRANKGARYGIGGYNEHRTIYSRSTHFNPPAGDEEPRRLHLGVDIWGPAGTGVYSFADGTVFGFANNNNFGDYGATIILKYQLGDQIFYALYGHLNAAALAELHIGRPIPKGTEFAQFGLPEENGGWPPHLHFQLILDMAGNTTDYPGVCKFSERAQYLINCPDPMSILKQSFYF